MTVVLTHTSALSSRQLAAIRPLLDASFSDGVTDDDLDHALGGIHAMVWSDEDLVGHASVVQRRILHQGRALRVGYVEGVAVHPEHRRRGHFGAMMNEIERVLRSDYDLGTLCASEMAAELYVARGWRRWPGTTSVLAPSGVVRTPEEDGNVYVLPGQVDVALCGDLACDWRNGDVW